jgi:hypothetical protein
VIRLVDVSERKQAETQQRVLVRELNHRVKNNMQMLQSLLRMATRQTQNSEARRVLEDATNRIAAMAAAQQVLYGASAVNKFSAAHFLDSVCEAARQAFPPRIKIVREVASGDLDNDDAMPLALILNEDDQGGEPQRSRATLHREALRHRSRLARCALLYPNLQSPSATRPRRRAASAPSHCYSLENCPRPAHRKNRCHNHPSPTRRTKLDTFTPSVVR